MNCKGKEFVTKEGVENEYAGKDKKNYQEIW